MLTVHLGHLHCVMMIVMLTAVVVMMMTSCPIVIFIAVWWMCFAHFHIQLFTLIHWHTSIVHLMKMLLLLVLLMLLQLQFIVACIIAAIVLHTIAKTNAVLWITQQFEAIFVHSAERGVRHRHARIECIVAQTIFGDIDFLFWIVV